MLFRRGINIFLLITVVLLFSSTVSAQKKIVAEHFANIDSLNKISEKIIKNEGQKGLDIALKALSESKKHNYLKGMADSYYNIGDFFYYSFQKDSALFYFRMSSNMAELIDNKYRSALCDYSIAYILYEIDKYDDAIYHAQKALVKLKEINDIPIQAKVLNLICEIYNFKGENDRAIDFCIKSIELYDQVENPGGKANVLNVVGNIYTQYKIFDKAEKHLNEALKISILHNNLEQQSVSYSSLAELYFSKDDFIKAYENYKLSYELDITGKDTLGLAYSSFSLGKTLVKLDSVEQALAYLEKSLELSQILQNNDLIANSYAMLGQAYHVKNQNEAALDYLNRSLSIAQEINALPILHTVYKTIAEYNEQSGQPETSLKFYKLYMECDDKMKQEENAKKIAEVDAIYELALKEKRIDFLTKENEIQLLKARERELINKGLMVLVLLTLMIAGVLLSRNRIKNKANKELKIQKEAINQQKEEIEQQRDDIQQKSIAIAEINKQITASIEYARRIQLSLFPSRNELKLIFPESFVFNKPKDIISGDFYWVTTLDDKVYLAVVDCTGHGVPGAFMTILASSLLNQIILENRISCPGMTLSLLDIKVKQNLHLNDNSPLIADGMDMGLCVIDKKERVIEFAGAKFNLYYSDGKKLCQVTGNRYPIGSLLFPDKRFNSTIVKLPENTTFYLATDGFQDQFGGESDTKYMKPNFKKLLSSIMTYSIDEQYHQICDSFHHWKGRNPQTDDILVLGVKL